MSVIQSTHAAHAAACVSSESQRQAAMATATTTAQLVAVEVAHLRRIVASCKTNGLPYGNFTEALTFLGTGGQ